MAAGTSWTVGVEKLIKFSGPTTHCTLKTSLRKGSRAMITLVSKKDVVNDKRWLERTSTCNVQSVWPTISRRSLVSLVRDERRFQSTNKASTNTGQQWVISLYNSNYDEIFHLHAKNGWKAGITFISRRVDSFMLTTWLVIDVLEFYFKMSVFASLANNLVKQISV